ncbi:MAG: 1-acyl-sn-glycerol-3-phosphate acyltransferase [Methylibium sp.]|nr:1-acyl-sn-glycerol-3-phosphate acyltransferase [Methylibium sp.]
MTSLRAFGDPIPRRSARWVRFFGAVMARHVRASFHALRIVRAGWPRLPPDTAVVAYCNHPSWWDAAVLPVLATRLFPGRCSFGPIDAQALRKYRFMERIGFFPVEQASWAGSARFLRTGQALLARPDTLLWITPEGSFTDPRRRPISLRPGLATLLARSPAVVALPVALEYPFWTERTPEALVRFGAPVLPAELADLRQPEIQAALERALGETMDALAIDAIARDETRFTTLLEGRAGIGGVYDGWRRLKAWSQGERFNPAHGTGPREKSR